MTVHRNIPPFTAFLSTEFLYDQDYEKIGLFELCQVYAISSYQGHCLTFKVILKSNGALFDYIPIHALNIGAAKQVDIPFSMEELTFGINCPSNDIAINEFSFIRDNKVLPWCYFPKSDKWVKATKYICTVDWYTENENVNLFVLENGQVATVPNHKLLFKEEKPTELPGYKKINSIWRNKK
jgi:hypothetical protein